MSLPVEVLNPNILKASKPSAWTAIGSPVFLGGGNSHVFGTFKSKIGEDESNLTSIFQIGWFNHQLDFRVFAFWLWKLSKTH